MTKTVVVELSVSFIDNPTLSAEVLWRDDQRVQSLRRVTAGDENDRFDIAVDAVQSCHMRAARAFLGWSMSALAKNSGLSISTVKRLEKDAETPMLQSREKVVATLRGAGVCFVSLEDGVIAVAKGSLDTKAIISWKQNGRVGVKS